jgi:hypothetical protein
MASAWAATVAEGGGGETDGTIGAFWIDVAGGYVQGRLKRMQAVVPATPKLRATMVKRTTRNTTTTTAGRRGGGGRAAADARRSGEA